MEDEKILELYRKRAESAIEETALKYGGYCTKIAMNILNSREDCAECVNDTYLNAWNAIPPQRPAIFSAFLGRITRNLSLNKYKAQRTKKRGGNELPLLLDELEECISSPENVESEYEAGELAKTISIFLYSIDRESRIVFVRRYWYIDSISDIAERLQMSEPKVKSMLFRTRNKLKAYLEHEGVVI